MIIFCEVSYIYNSFIYTYHSIFYEINYKLINCIKHDGFIILLNLFVYEKYKQRKMHFYFMIMKQNDKFVLK